MWSSSLVLIYQHKSLLAERSRKKNSSTQHSSWNLWKWTRNNSYSLFWVSVLFNSQRTIKTAPSFFLLSFFFSIFCSEKNRKFLIFAKKETSDCSSDGHWASCVKHDKSLHRYKTNKKSSDWIEPKRDGRTCVFYSAWFWLWIAVAILKCFDVFYEWEKWLTMDTIGIIVDFSRVCRPVRFEIIYLAFWRSPRLWLVYSIKMVNVKTLSRYCWKCWPNPQGTDISIDECFWSNLFIKRSLIEDAEDADFHFYSFFTRISYFYAKGQILKFSNI